MSGAPPAGLAQRTVGWAATTMVAMVALAVGFDLAAVAAHVHPALPLRTLAAGVAEGAALACLVTLLGAPLAACLEIVCARLASGSTRWRRLWPLPIALATAAVGLLVSGLTLYGREGGNVVVVAGFAAAITAVAIASTDRRPFVARAVPAVILLGSLWATVRLTSLRTDHRDLLAMVAVCALQGLVTPLRLGGRRSSRLALAVAVALASVACLGELLPAPEALARWRLQSDQFARFQPAVRRSARALWDLDFDEASPILGGGDCDDTTASRNPRATELPDGVDRNCNGTTRPVSPTAADRGLAPAAGTPGPASGALDLVILVSIDCLRVDAVTPETTPNLYKLASSGAWMARMYSEGTKTMHSLPFLQRPKLGDRPIAAQLAPRGITSTAIVGMGVGADVSLAGFDRTHAPDLDERWTASQVTDLALADLDGLHAPHYLWVHYYDAHSPLDALPGDVGRGPLPGSYLREVGVIDKELGRLVGTLEGRGQLARAAIIVTGDHGEAFGAHGIPFHAAMPYEPLIHVPGIFVAPGIAPVRYDGLVSHRDIPVTILAAFGVDVAHDEQFGRSWLRLKDAGAAPLHDFVVSRGSTSGVHGQREQPIGAIVTPRRKVIERYDVRYFMLFDPAADPGEDADLADTEPDTTARLRRQLAVYRDLDPR